MFDTVRLNARGLATRWEMACWSVRGAYPSAFSTRSAPSGWPPRLRLPISSITQARRRSGSGSSQGRSTNTNEIWFPSSAAPFLPRTLTGTIVLRRTGGSPRAGGRNARHRPPRASTTSLTVAPKRSLMAQVVQRAACARARCRRGEIGSLRQVLRVAARSESASARALGSACGARPASRRGMERHLERPAHEPERLAGAVAIASTTSSHRPGSERAASGRARTPAASGVGSTSSDASSTAAIPSTIAWCAFPITPTRPSGSSSAIQSSQSGRSRPSCSDITSSTSRPRSGELLWCTWRSTVELAVVDPHRVVDRQRHGRELLPVAGRAAHAAATWSRRSSKRGWDDRAVGRSSPPNPRACAPMSSLARETTHPAS